MANPMLYVVNTFREGMLGVSDVSSAKDKSWVTKTKVVFINAFNENKRSVIEPELF